MRVKTRESVTLTIFIYRGGSATALGRLAHPQIFWNRGTSHPTPFRPVAAGRAEPDGAPLLHQNNSIYRLHHTGTWAAESLFLSLSLSSLFFLALSLSLSPRNAPRSTNPLSASYARHEKLRRCSHPEHPALSSRPYAIQQLALCSSEEDYVVILVRFNSTI